MSDKQDLIHQLAITKAVAENANDRVADEKADALAPPMDEGVVAACDEATAENDKVIAKCNAAIVDAIVAKSGFDQFLAALHLQTGRMAAQSAALDATVAGLKTLERIAKDAVDVLGFLGV